MELRNKKLIKGMVMSTILASSLLFGSMGVAAESNVTINKENQTFKSASTIKAATTVSKKGVITFPNKSNLTKVTNELKPEAVNLIKIYGDALYTGKTNAFDAYVEKHVEVTTRENFFLGWNYSKDSFSNQIKGIQKRNSKNTLKTYSKAVKQITTSTVKVDKGGTKINGRFARVVYQFEPKGFNALSSVTVSFCFRQVEDGTYVLEYIVF